MNINDIYAYPTALIMFFLIWLIIYSKRKDLRKRMLLSGTIMLPVTLLEYWCLQDYWNPPGPYFLKFISIENIIFFFLVTGISVSIYDFIFKKKNLKKLDRNIIFPISFIITTILSLIIFTDYLGYNSIMVINFVILFGTIFVVFLRKDLLASAFVSGIFTAILSIIFYHFLFNILFTEYWDKYWLLNNTQLGVKIFNNIPLTEVFWYFSWGSFCGVVYNYAAGHIKK